jgi:hypothetical protein
MVGGWGRAAHPTRLLGALLPVAENAVQPRAAPPRVGGAARPVDGKDEGHAGKAARSSWRGSSAGAGVVGAGALVVVGAGVMVAGVARARPARTRRAASMVRACRGEKRVWAVGSERRERWASRPVVGCWSCARDGLPRTAGRMGLRYSCRAGTACMLHPPGAAPPSRRGSSTLRPRGVPGARRFWRWWRPRRPR